MDGAGAREEHGDDAARSVRRVCRFVAAQHAQGVTNASNAVGPDLHSIHND